MTQITHRNVIANILDEKHISQLHAAKLLGLTYTDMMKLVVGELPITRELADKLSCVFGLTPQFWLKYDSDRCELLNVQQQRKRTISLVILAAIISVLLITSAAVCLKLAAIGAYATMSWWHVLSPVILMIVTAGVITVIAATIDRMIAFVMKHVG